MATSAAYRSGLFGREAVYTTALGELSHSAARTCPTPSGDPLGCATALLFAPGWA